MPVDQTDVFSEDEGDRWFRRNESALAHQRHDRVLEMILRNQPVQSICELGCANGWRLAAAAETIEGVSRLAGCDLSKQAIAAGRAQWPKLEMTVGSLDAPGIPGSFDLVIVSFVFHWVARDRLAASVSAVDALVRDGGALIIADFLPSQPTTRRYHHRDDVEILTYKQDYTSCFTELGTYAETEREVFAHSGSTEGSIDPQDRAVCALLRKTLDRRDGA